MKLPPHIVATANKLALKVPPVRNQRLVAIIFDKKYIEGVGFAKMKTHPLQKSLSRWQYLHAEIDAITSAARHVTSPNRKFSLQDCSIYVHRIKPDGTIGLAKPCINCMTALTKIFGITDIYWSVSDGNTSSN